MVKIINIIKLRLLIESYKKARGNAMSLFPNTIKLKIQTISIENY